MKYCEKCGASMDDGASFCPKCGAKCKSVRGTAYNSYQSYFDNYGQDKSKDNVAWKTSVLIACVVALLMAVVILVMTAGR